MDKNTEIVGQSERGAKEGQLFRLYIWPFLLSTLYVMIQYYSINQNINSFVSHLKSW